MASTKLTEPPKKKAKFLNPDQILKYWTVVMRDLKMTTVELWIVNNLGHISHCCNRSKHPCSMTIHSVSVDTTTEVAHSPSPSDVSEEEEHEKNEPDQGTPQKQAGLQWKLPSDSGICRVYNYTGGPRGKKKQEMPHINDIIFLLLFAGVITLQVVTTN
jgi:hypothetical protein